MLTIELSGIEVALAKFIAGLRNGPKERRGAHTPIRDGSKSALDMHIMGFLAELAVAKHLNLYPDFRQLPYGDGHSGDLHFNGKAIEVKCRERVGWDFALYSTNPSEFGADLGVLVYRLSESAMGIAGFISRADFLKRATTKNYGYGPRLAVGPDELRPIGELVEGMQ